ncbi:Uncharacterised protein [Mycobacteroides abscessus subsp. abscessus]|nr:Uncharacterised protein [Mycobacteroides abscessus subsp. abscessus]
MTCGAGSTSPSSPSLGATNAGPAEGNSGIDGDGTEDGTVRGRRSADTGSRGKRWGVPPLISAGVNMEAMWEGCAPMVTAKRYEPALSVASRSASAVTLEVASPESNSRSTEPVLLPAR